MQEIKITKTSNMSRKIILKWIINCLLLDLDDFLNHLLVFYMKFFQKIKEIRVFPMFKTNFQRHKTSRYG
jgi:hypothetical protein